MVESGIRRIVHFLAAIFICAACTTAIDYNVAGIWEMVVNKQLHFDLDVVQNGNRISGIMTRTDGQEPVDNITG